MTTTDAAGPSPREQDEFIKVLAQGIWLYNPALLAGQAEEQARNIHDQLKRDWCIAPVEQRAGVVEIPLDVANGIELILRTEMELAPHPMGIHKDSPHAKWYRALQAAIACATGDGEGTT
jgi:hypothetical protein